MCAAQRVRWRALSTATPPNSAQRGGMRLKLRLTPETILVGRDVINYPDFQPGKRDQFGVLITGLPVYHAVGGDFREAKIVNGIAVRKGWYFEPKTGQKIETNF